MKPTRGSVARWALVGLGAAGWALSAAGCLSARAVERNYFVLHGDPIDPGVDDRPFDGLVRVRDMDTDSVYEKFQIVVRRSPYQLRYSNQNVWAVKPNQMVSDLIAQALESSHAFTGVTRELRDARPAFTMAGTVSAIELYDSGDLWFAHLALHLQLTRFGDGSAIWTYDFDRRKQINSQAFEHGVRALSELLHQAIVDALGRMQALDARLARRANPRPAPVVVPAPAAPSADNPAPSLLFVPESSRASRSTTPPVWTRTATPTAVAPVP